MALGEVHDRVCQAMSLMQLGQASLNMRKMTGVAGGQILWVALVLANRPIQRKILHMQTNAVIKICFYTA